MNYQVLEDLFPFHFHLDASLRFIGLGKSSAKLFSLVRQGDSLLTHLKIVRPISTVTFQSLLEQKKSVFVFRHNQRPDLQIKGQMVHLAETNSLLFVFTPIVREVSFFKEFGITMQDFPLHDTTLELLFALQASQRALEEATLLSKEFEEKVNIRTLELKNINEKIKAQNEEYITQQEQLNKQSISLAEKNRKLINARGLIHAKNKELKKHSKNLENEVQQRTHELTLINQELLSQNNQLEQFAFIVAHNLRAPIARISGLTNLMKLESLINSENQYYIESIHTATLRLDEVIKDLNLILEIKKGLPQAYENLYLSVKLRKVKETLKTQIEESNATITADFSKADHIYSIKSYLENIIYNLVSNAIKYRHEDRPPVITITSDQSEDHVILTVKDNGIGLDVENNKENLFKLYKRFHDHVEGKGLGLYMMKTQTEVLGGDIHVESKPGAGSVFTIKIKKHKLPTLQHA